MLNKNIKCINNNFEILYKNNDVAPSNIAIGEVYSKAGMQRIGTDMFLKGISRPRKHDFLDVRRIDNKDLNGVNITYGFKSAINLEGCREIPSKLFANKEVYAKFGSDIEVIGSYAFSNYNLKEGVSLTFPKCKKIGDYAFYNLAASGIDISIARNAYIGERAFANLNANTIDNITNASYIGANAFYGCQLSSQSLVFKTSESMQIVRDAFNGAPFTQLNFMTGNFNYAASAFRSHSSLVTISFNSKASHNFENLQSIFYGCNNLENITLPGKLSSGVVAGIFTSLPKLKNIHFNCTNIGTIQTSAFYSCRSLKYITMLNKYSQTIEMVIRQTVGSQPFAGTALSNLFFGNTALVKPGFFNGMSKLQTIYVIMEEGKSTKLPTLIDSIPDCVTRIYIDYRILNNGLSTLAGFDSHWANVSLRIQSISFTSLYDLGGLE